MNHWKAITSIGIMKIQQSGAQNPTIFRLSNANSGSNKWNFIETNKMKK